MAVEGGRDLPPELLPQRHPGGGGQLPAIGKHSAAKDGASRRIQGPAGGSEMHVEARRKKANSFSSGRCLSAKPSMDIKQTDLAQCLQPTGKTDAASLDI